MHLGSNPEVSTFFNSEAVKRIVRQLF
jgi:hypothetical protein